MSEGEIVIPPRASWIRRMIYWLKRRLNYPIPELEKEYDTIQDAINGAVKAGGTVFAIPHKDSATTDVFICYGKNLKFVTPKSEELT